MAGSMAGSLRKRAQLRPGRSSYGSLESSLAGSLGRRIGSTGMMGSLSSSLSGIRRPEWRLPEQRRKQPLG